MGDESRIEIEWVGRCRWLDLFTGFVSLNKASRSMVKRAGELCSVMVAIVLNDIRFLYY